jgi:transcriptional regulator GlxA family with amidase domain
VIAGAGVASALRLRSNAGMITTTEPTGISAPAVRGKFELSIGFILVPDFTLTPFSALIDALRISADAGPGSRQIHCRWTIMGPDTQAVTSSCGVRIEPWERFRDPTDFDYIAVTGGLLHRSVFDDARTFEYLRSAGAAGVKLIGLCTGAFILARAGLMTGRRACIHWLHKKRWASEFPDIEAVIDRLFVVDRGRITSAGGTGVFDLALYLIERHKGPAEQLKLMQYMMMDGARPPEHRYAHFPEEIRDSRIRKAVLLMQQNLAHPIPLGELARWVNMSPRHLDRAFRSELLMGPSDYARQLRLRHGLWLLTNTDVAVTQIARECGFADGSHFSRWCRSAFGRAPTDLRANRTGSDRSHFHELHKEEGEP